MVTPYKLISHENANIRKVYFIIAWLLRVVRSVQYFLENVFINVQNLIDRISIAFRSELNAHF